MVSARFNLLHLLVILLIGAATAAVVLPGLQGSDRDGMKTACMSNLKQLGTCMQIYLADYDDLFPPKTWHDELMPYAKRAELFDCLIKDKPHSKWGYAMNYRLLGREANFVKDASKMPVLFEIDAFAKDVVANIGARSLTRHKTGSNVGRFDTSVHFFRATATDPELK